MTLRDSINKTKDFLIKNKLIIFIVLVGSFLRFYRLEEFATFLGDQGRDAIIIKRIITLEHLPAIGPPTSVGQVYLGPFFYYFIAPWLLIFNLNPLGLAFGVAFFSSVFILIDYFIVKELFGKKIAIISTILVAFSSTLIEMSRFSWNPNLLPLFSLLTVYFLIKSIKSSRWYFFLLTGSFLSFSIQLHYLALFLIPPILVILIIEFIANKKKRRKIARNSFFSLVSFSFFSLPLLIFDLRHDFLNAKNFLNLFKNSKDITTNKLTDLISTFDSLNKFTFNLDINDFFLIFFLIALLVSFLILLKKRSNLTSLFIFFIFLLLGISLYSGPKHPHYFAVLYPLYFIVIAYFLSFLLPSRFGALLVLVFFLIFVFCNSHRYYFLFGEGSNQIAQARAVANFLNKVIDSDKFNFAVQPDGWQEDAYLYFLELMGKRPLDRRKVEIGEEMFVVCGQPCNLYRTRSWNVRMFGQFKIVKDWTVEDVKIYKLVH